MFKETWGTREWHLSLSVYLHKVIAVFTPEGILSFLSISLNLESLILVIYWLMYEDGEGSYI
jgi:hypothetical protein